MKGSVYAVFSICALTLTGGPSAAGERAGAVESENLDSVAEPVIADRLTMEDYAVFRAVMLPYLKRKALLVVMDRTSDRSSPLVRVDPTGFGVGPALARAFNAANQRPALLEAHRFRLPKPVVLLGEAQHKAIFALGGTPPDDGWSVFYRHFPGSQGVMTLSRPGFDPMHRTAVVHVRNQAHWLSGEGFLFLLARQADGTWKVVDKHLTGMS